MSAGWPTAEWEQFKRMDDRIAELESEIASLQATAEADAQVNAQLHDELRAKQIDVNSAALTEAHKRIAKLERALWRIGDVCESHSPDEYRWRSVAYLVSEALPWEKGE